MSGSTQCLPCDVSFYQPSEGQTSCLACYESRTTRLLGASSELDCVCKGGKIEVPSDENSSTCVDCPDGLNCPEGSTVQKLEAATGVSDTQTPFVKKGFTANSIDPLKTYKCVEEHWCPGGAPGTCFGGREGIACGDCPVGTYWANKCEECGLAMPVVWISGLTILVIGLCGSYYMLTSSYTAKASVLMCTTASLGMLLALFQNLGVLSTVTVPWPPGRATKKGNGRPNDRMGHNGPGEFELNLN